MEKKVSELVGQILGEIVRVSIPIIIENVVAYVNDNNTGKEEAI